MEYAEHALECPFAVTSIVNARRLHCPKAWHFEGERHKVWEMQYMASGNTYIHLEHQFHKMHQGELVLLRPDTFHVVYADGEQDSEMWVITFGAEGTGLDEVGRGLFSVSGEGETLLRELLESVEAGFQCSDRTDIPDLLVRKKKVPAGNDQLIRVRLEEILLLLLQSVEQPNAFAGWGELKNIDRQDFLAERIYAYMLRHVQGQLSLSQVSQAFYISESTVKTIYKKRFGISLISDYHRHKTERAKLLLFRRELTVGQISSLLGFETVYYFSNFFKKNTGMSPSAYRKLLESQNI